MAQTQYFPPSSYHHLLAELMHYWDPNPNKGEEYGDRLRRVLKGKKILEMGARFGTFVEFLKKHGADAHGIESNPHAVDLAEKNGIELIDADAARHRSRIKFDAVVSHQFRDNDYWNDTHGRSQFLLTTILDNVHGMLKPNGASIHTTLGRKSMAYPMKFWTTVDMKSLFNEERGTGRVSISKRLESSQK